MGLTGLLKTAGACGSRGSLGQAIGPGSIGVAWRRGGYRSVESQPSVADWASRVELDSRRTAKAWVSLP
jgi:hypothetical protein